MSIILRLDSKLPPDTERDLESKTGVRSDERGERSTDGRTTCTEGTPPNPSDGRSDSTIPRPIVGNMGPVVTKSFVGTSVCWDPNSGLRSTESDGHSGVCGETLRQLLLLWVTTDVSGSCHGPSHTWVHHGRSCSCHVSLDPPSTTEVGRVYVSIFPVI